MLCSSAFVCATASGFTGTLGCESTGNEGSTGSSSLLVSARPLPIGTVGFVISMGSVTRDPVALDSTGSEGPVESVET